MTPPAGTKTIRVPLLAALLVAAADQATKMWVAKVLPLYEAKMVIAGCFDLVHVRNTGVAFSLFAGFDGRWLRPMLMAVTVLAIAGLLFFSRFLCEKKSGLWGLGLIVGGAVGNLIDRARFGYVIDFVDLYLGRFHWPAFNIADIGITAGVFLLAADMIFENKERDAPRPPADR